MISRRHFLSSIVLLAGSHLLTSLNLLNLADRAEQRQVDQTETVYLPVVQQNRARIGPVIQVGPARIYKTPSAVAAVVKDGDIVEIDAGVYSGDTATWHQNNLILRGVNGMAHLAANGQSAGGKAIWVIQGNNTTVENIEFSGATVTDQNGAGIRQEGANLTVRTCFFHDNQEGILAGDNPSSEILIESSEFARNGAGDGYSHNLYINHVKKFTFQYCYSHHAYIGHLVKSRAQENYILYNLIMDEADGTASYEIDLPNGGLTYIVGNLIQQGPLTENPTLLTYNEETSGTNPIQEVYIVNNTLVNDRSSGGTFIRVIGSATASLIVNNLMVGNGTPISGVVSADHNLLLDGTSLVNRAGYDYHLSGGSSAIDGGRDPGFAQSLSLVPVKQYVHPLTWEPRFIHGVLDVGSYEK